MGKLNHLSVIFQILTLFLMNLIGVTVGQNEEDLGDVHTLNPMSKYCTQNIKEVEFVTCRYHDMNKTVYLPADLNIGIDYNYVGIEIYDATSLILGPICIERLRIVGSANRNTEVRSNYQESTCESSIGFTNCSILNLNGGFTYLGIRNSTVSNIALIGEQKFLLLSDSKVEDLQSLSMSNAAESDDSRINRCLVKRTSHLILTARSVKETTFENVERFAIEYKCEKSCMVEKCNFGHISYWGLSFSGMGEVILSDVIFENLDQLSIVVEDTSNVLFRDVNVKNAEISSILIYDCSSVTFINFTIGGINIDCYSKYVTSSVSGTDHHVKINRKNNYGIKDEPRKSMFDEKCIEDEDTIYCNCDSGRPHWRDRLPYSEGKDLTVERCYLLSIDDWCNGKIILNHISGSIKLKQDEKCIADITISNSFILAVRSRSNISELSLHVENTRLQILEVNDVKRLRLFNVSMLDLQKLSIPETGPNVSQIFEERDQSDTQVDFIIKNATIAKLGLIHINNDKAPIIMDNISIEELKPGSITIQTGELQMKDVDFKMFPKGGVYLEENGRLQLEGKSAWPSSAYRFISALSEDQVISLLPQTEDIIGIKWLLILRNSGQLEAKHLKESIIISDKQEDEIDECWRHTVGLKGLSMYCDFEGNSEISVDIIKNADELNQMETFQEIFVKNTKIVNVFPTSFKNIHLRNIAEINFIPYQYSQLNSTQVSSSSSQIYDPVRGIENFLIEKSNTEVIELDYAVPTFNITETTVGKITNLHIEGEKSKLLKSKIGSVKRLLISSDWIVEDVSFGEIKSFGIIIDKKVFIKQSHFGFVDKYGIVINEDVSIINTIVDHLDENAIHLVSGKPSLYMENVAVLNGSLNSFKLDSYCSVTLINVTIGGKEVQLPKKLQFVD